MDALLCWRALVLAGINFKPQIEDSLS